MANNHAIELAKMLHANPSGLLSSWVVIGARKDRPGEWMHVIKARTDAEMLEAENYVLTLAKEIMEQRKARD